MLIYYIYKSLSIPVFLCNWLVFVTSVHIDTFNISISYNNFFSNQDIFKHEQSLGTYTHASTDNHLSKVLIYCDRSSLPAQTTQMCQNIKTIYTRAVQKVLRLCGVSIYPNIYLLAKRGPANVCILFVNKCIQYLINNTNYCVYFNTAKLHDGKHLSRTLPKFARISTFYVMIS